MSNAQKKKMLSACRFGRVGEVQQLLKEAPSLLNASLDEDGRTPLHCASQFGKTEVVKVLLASNADINKQDENGWTPLHSASYNGETEVVKVLLASNADPNKQNEDGRTPLHASYWGKTEVVKVLLASNADPNKQDENGWTPLHSASQYGQTEVVRVLLASNADPNKQDEYGRTPLHWASYNGETEVVKVLLASNADPNKQDEDGWTPLYSASYNGKTEVVKVLLASNADPNKQDKDGEKPGDSFASGEDFCVEAATKQEIEQLFEKERKKRKEAQQQKSTTSSSSSSSVSFPSSAASSSPSPSSPFIGSTPTSSSSPSPASSSSSQNFGKGFGSTTSSFGSTSTSPSTLSSPSSSASSSSPSSSTFGSTHNTPSTFGSPSHSNTSSSPSPSSSFIGSTPTSLSSPSPASPSSPQVSETQEAERIGAIKCKFGEDAARFSVTKTTTFEELIAMVEGEWGEGKGVKYQDCDGDWLKMKNNDDVVEVWNQTKSGVVTLKVFSQQNQSSSSLLPTTNSPPSTPTSSTAQTPTPSSEIAQASEIGWETSNINPPPRCFKRSPQLPFQEAIRALLLGLPEVPPRRDDLFIADEDDFDALISHCERTLSQMEQFGSAEVKRTVGLLKRDEALAILAYTCEDPYPVYRWLNAWLVQDRRDPLVKSKVGPFFRLLYQGLEKLPQKVVKAGRGVLVYDIPVLRNCFNSPPLVGSEISFWGVSSFSVEDSVASGFGGAAGEDAIFYTCGRLHCVSLGGFSLNPREAEVLPLPPAVFKVNSTFQVNAKKLVISLDHEQATHSAVSYVPPKK